MSKEIIGQGRRVSVDAYNRVQGTSNVFALGDLCSQTTDKTFPNRHPQVAQVAIQGGQKLAGNLRRLQDGKAMQPFRYKDKGSMAIISKYNAVADLPKFSFQGFLVFAIRRKIIAITIIGTFDDSAFLSEEIAQPFSYNSKITTVLLKVNLR